MKRRASIEPITGQMKAEHRMDRNYLKGRDGDRINAVTAAVGFNFHLLLSWLESLLHAWLQALLVPPPFVPNRKRNVLHVRLQLREHADETDSDPI
jgi:transposase, IS5 family